MDETCLNVASWYGPARDIKLGQARDLVCLLDAYKQARGMAKTVTGDAIVAYLKRIPGWRSPYKFFSKTNVRHQWAIVSYHHRAQLCWEWSLHFSVGKPARGKWWRWFGSGYGQTFVSIPHLFEFRFHRQPYDWMVSGDAEQLIRMTWAYHKGPQDEAA